MKQGLCVVVLGMAVVSAVAGCQKYYGMVHLPANEDASPKEIWACQWFASPTINSKGDYCLFEFWLSDQGEWKGRKQVGATHWFLEEIEATDAGIRFRLGDEYALGVGTPMDVLEDLLGDYILNKVVRGDGPQEALMLAEDRISAILFTWDAEVGDWKTGYDLPFTRRERLTSPPLWKFDVFQ